MDGRLVGVADTPTEGVAMVPVWESVSDIDLARVRCKLLHSSITEAFLARIGDGFATSELIGTGGRRVVRVGSELLTN